MDQNNYAYNVINDNKDEKQAKSAISRFGIALTVYLVVSIFALLAGEIAVILLFGQEGAEKIFASPYFLLTANAVVMYLIAFPIFYIMVKKMEHHPIKKRKMPIKQFFGYFFASVALMYIGSYIGTFVNEGIAAILEIEIENPLDSIILDSPIWLVILVAVVIGPIVEELIFRKLLIERLDKWGDVFSIVISAVAFGLFHGNFSQFFYATLLGLLLGFVYTRTGNILHTILLHISINFFGSILPMPVMQTLEEYEIMLENYMQGIPIDMDRYLFLSGIQSVYSLFVMGCFITGLVLLFKYTKRLAPKQNKCAVALNQKKIVSTVFLNAGALLFIAFSALQFILNIFTQ